MATDENIDTNKEIALHYITESYKPIGESQTREYITSADIARELQEMTEVTIAVVSDLMYNSGFKLDFIDGKPHWEVYIK